MFKKSEPILPKFLLSLLALSTIMVNLTIIRAQSNDDLIENKSEVQLNIQGPQDTYENEEFHIKIILENSGDANITIPENLDILDVDVEDRTYDQDLNILMLSNFEEATINFKALKEGDCHILVKSNNNEFETISYLVSIKPYIENKLDEESDIKHDEESINDMSTCQEDDSSSISKKAVQKDSLQKDLSESTLDLEKDISQLSTTDFDLSDWEANIIENNTITLGKFINTTKSKIIIPAKFMDKQVIVGDGFMENIKTINSTTPNVESVVFKTVDGEKVKNNISNTKFKFNNIKLDTIDFSGLDISNITSMYGAFQNSEFKNLNLNHLDTSNVTAMQSMFRDSKIDVLDLSNLKGDNLISINNMFFGATIGTLDFSNFESDTITIGDFLFSRAKIGTLNLTNFALNNARSMQNTFASAEIDNLFLEGFVTDQVTNMRNMFSNANIKELDLSSFNTENVTNMNEMFANSTIKYLDVSSFKTDSLTHADNLFNSQSIKVIDASNFKMDGIIFDNNIFGNGKKLAIIATDDYFKYYDYNAANLKPFTGITLKASRIFGGQGKFSDGSTTKYYNDKIVLTDKDDLVISPEKYSDFLQNIPIPTSSTKIFSKWYPEYNGVDAGLLYEFNKIHTANYKNLTYKISYNTLGGTPISDESVLVNTLFTKPTDPTKDHFIFDGWYLESTYENEYDFNTPATSDIEVYAKWTPENYTITYHSNGGSHIVSETVEYNQKFNEPTDPTKEHYIFAGWYTDSSFTTAYDFSTPATSNIDVYAKWIAIDYIVDFETNGGLPIPSDQNLNYDNLVVEPTEPTKEHYVFDGWVTSSDELWDFDTDTVEDSMTLYAKWTPENYTITYNSNGGSHVVSETVAYNDVFTEPSAPTREHYIFDGWYLESTYENEYDFSTPATSNIEVYAKWLAVDYIVEFDTNGGFPVPANQSLNYGNLVVEPTKPTKDHHTFDGWFTSSDELWDFDADTVEGSMTLYAKWTPESYTITYDSNGGSRVESETVEYNELFTKPTSPIREDYIFDGWYSDTGLTTAFDFNSPATADIEVYAKWDVADDETMANPEVNDKNDSQVDKEDNTSQVPETGVINQPPLYYVMMLLSSFILYVLRRKKKRIK